MAIKFSNVKKEAVKRIRLLVFDVDGVLTDGNVYLDGNGNELKQFNTKDGLGIDRALEEGFKIAIISGRKSKAVSIRAKQLGINFVYQGIKDKRKILRDLQKKLKITKGETSFMGDDLPDLEVKDEVSLFVCPADAVQEVRKKADFIVSKNGGCGAVREWIDVVLSLSKGI